MQTQSPGLVMHDVNADTEYEIQSGSWICYPPDAKVSFHSECTVVGDDTVTSFESWTKDDENDRKSSSLLHRDLRDVVSGAVHRRFKHTLDKVLQLVRYSKTVDHDIVQDQTKENAYINSTGDEQSDDGSESPEEYAFDVQTKDVHEFPKLLGIDEDVDDVEVIRLNS